jgi:hypothetical protein
LIFSGNPMKDPTGPLIGIAHLNNLRCVPTGDPEFPVLYVDRKQKKHLIRHTHVIHIADAPDGDDSYPGYGLSALSRSIAIVAQQLYMNRYIEAKLDDQPSPGIVVASNINQAQRNAAFNAYNQEQGNDTRPVWGKTAWLYSVDPTAPAKLESVTFSEAPENWNYKEYTEIHVNALALALGADVQELWQLTGGTLGSGQQSMVLHAKSQNKTFSALLNALEPKLDAALPDYQEFEFVVRDPYAVQDEALAFQGWTGGLSTAGPDTLSPDEKRQILANAIPMVRDVIGTASGGVTPAPEPVLPEGDVPGATGPRADAEGPRRLAKPERTQGERKEERKELEEAVKADDIPETPRSAFEHEFRVLLDAVAAGTVTEVALRLLLRDLLQRYGIAAYQRALTELGRERDESNALMDDADNSAILLLLASLAPFVRSFAKEVLSAPHPEIYAARADVWFNKSIQPFIDEARYKAAPNARYTFVGDDGAETCADCARLKDLTRPMWWWKATRQRPRTDTESFSCGGFHCQHVLEAA